MNVPVPDSPYQKSKLTMIADDADLLYIGVTIHDHWNYSSGLISIFEANYIVASIYQRILGSD
jgi:hypothetical protein